MKIRSSIRAMRKAWRLRRIGRGPVGLIDVGSVGGLEPPWDGHEHDLRFLLGFEPNDAAIRRPQRCTYNTALWDAEAELPFYIYKGFNATGSSLFRQNFDYVDANWESLKVTGPKTLADTWHERSQLVRTATLKCRRLDDVLKDEGLQESMHFLKIDAQGAEGPILRGARDFLANQCVGLQLELFKIPLYEGIMLKPEVTALLDSLGFDLALEMPAHGTFDSQNDCVFLHRSRGPREVRDVIRSVYGLA